MATRRTSAPAKQPPKRKNARVDRGDVVHSLKDLSEGGNHETWGRLGRPSLWQEREIGLVTQLCLLGLTNAELAANLGVTERTIENWMSGKEPVFVRAVKEGREEADAKVAGSLYARAVGYEYDEQVAVPTGRGEVSLVTVRKKLPPDVAAAFIWLKNRRRKDWKDKHEDAPQDPTAAAKVIQDAVAAALAVTKPEGEGDAEGGAV